jgi:FAD:protein FMN transferase
VTVVHCDAALADAAATALLVAGPQRWVAVAAGLGFDRALVINGEGCLVCTPSLARQRQN